MSTIIDENGNIQSISRLYKARVHPEWGEADKRRQTFRKLSILFENMMIDELDIMARIEKREGF